MVVGNTDHIEWSKQLLKDIALPQTFIVETAARNTAAAIAFAALAVDENDILIINIKNNFIHLPKTMHSYNSKEMAWKFLRDRLISHYGL